jgi:hypothetical protein
MRATRKLPTLPLPWQGLPRPGILLGGNLATCRYFDGGWYERVMRSLASWQILDGIGHREDLA